MAVRKYELSFWLRSDGQVALDKINKILGELGIDVVKTIAPKEGKLAYPIKKETSGLFGTIYFQAEAEKIFTLKSKLKTMPEILRFIILKRVKIDES
ncbi:MAG: 30S ribosomal protein S6 [Patescibacteria group bacterium]|nr:30S ribosomal protein S6 [Patescibacteria group bacterium]